MDKEVKQMFADEDIDFNTLAEAFPGVAEYFKTGKPGNINHYDNGVMSMVIDQDKEQNSTFGYLPEGDFVFNVGDNRETMHFLHGEIDWGFGDNPTVRPSQYDMLVIPPGEDLRLHVKKPTLYVCDYLKRQ